MTDRELKELFEKKFAGQKHPVNLDNWRRMESILDAGKPNLSFFWRSAALIVSAFSLALAFLPSSLPQTVSSPSPNTALPLGSPRVAEPVAPEPVAPEPTATAAPVIATPTLAADKRASRKAQDPTRPSTENPQIAASAIPAVREEQNYFSPAIASPGEALDWQTLAALSAPSIGLVDVEPVDENGLFGLGAPKPPLQGSFWLSAGTGINNSYNNESSPGWQMGIHYQQTLSPRWSLAAGVQYHRSGSLGIERITDSVFFALGRTDIHTHEHFKHFSSLQFPLEVAYRQGKHSLVAGATFSRLLSVSWDTERRVQVIKQDERVQNFSRNQFHEQFATWRGAFSFSYRLQLSERWQAEAQYLRQWSPTVNTDNTGFNRPYRLQHLQLGLRYQLWKP